MGWVGGGRGGGLVGWGARVSDFFFTQYKNVKKKFFGGLRGGGVAGGGGLGGEVDGWTDEQPKPICPFNFFEVGGTTIH